VERCEPGMQFHSFMDRLAVDERAALESAGTVRLFRAGTAILHQGDPSTHVLIIRRGWVKVVADVPAGGRCVLGIRGPGDLLGEAAVLHRQPRLGTVLAADSVETIVVPGSRFTRLLTDRPGLAIAVARMLSERLAECDGYRLAGGALGTAPALAGLLLDLTARFGQSTEDGRLSLSIGVSQADLASCLAVSPRTVARTIASWRRTGVIRTARQLIVVARPSALRAIRGTSGRPSDPI
jgi:CRP/FNR family cyclic AMP-dependent transcriptional regulator